MRDIERGDPVVPVALDSASMDWAETEAQAADLAALFAAEAQERGIESPEGIAIAVNGRVVRRAAHRS